MTGLRLLLRVAGALLLAAIAWVHADLWLDGYRDIPTIGWLFALNVGGAAVLAVAGGAVGGGGGGAGAEPVPGPGGPGRSRAGGRHRGGPAAEHPGGALRLP